MILFEWLLEATIDPGSGNHEYGPGTICSRHAFIFFFFIGILDPVPFFVARVPGITDPGDCTSDIADLKSLRVTFVHECRWYMLICPFLTQNGETWRHQNTIFSQTS